MKELSCQHWVDIDLDILGSNCRALGEYLDPDCRLLAVVKADAYGHGALPVARTFLDNGADYLGVATMTEGIELREGGVEDAPILVFSPIEPDEAGLIVEYGLTATIAHVNAAQALSTMARVAGVTARAHIKVDTGMSRFGLMPAALPSFVRGVERLPNVEWEGIYSHFADAYSPGGTERCERQYARFMAAILELAEAGFEFPLKHIANSAGVFASRNYHLDMVRVGNALYGLYGSTPKAAGDHRPEPKPRDSWTFFARIVQVKEVARGTRVGYGGRFVAPQAMRIGTVGVGLADGFGVEAAATHYRVSKLLRSATRVMLERLGMARQLGLTPSTGWVKLQGRIIPIVGMIGMQHCMVDLTDVPSAIEGDVVTLVTLRTSVNPRVPRVYVRDGQPRLARVLGRYHNIANRVGHRLRLEAEERSQAAAARDW